MCTLGLAKRARSTSLSRVQPSATGDAFLSSLAHFYGELNVRHPFREGNGRTLRAFLRQLGAAAGFQLDWSELNTIENVEACRIHLNTTDTTMLKRILDPVVRRIG